LKSWFGVQSCPSDDAAEPGGPIEDFFVRLESMSRSRKLDAALDFVFDFVDELLLAGRFREVNRFLRGVPVEKLDPAILVGFLTITGPARMTLDAWPELIVRIKAQLRESMPPEELARVMVGLE